MPTFFLISSIINAWQVTCRIENNLRSTNIPIFKAELLGEIIQRSIFYLSKIISYSSF